MSAPCRDAGCRGVVEDGYCTVCGLAGGPPAPAAVPAGPVPGAAYLAFGLVDLPIEPVPSPESLLSTNPVVPESRRFCACGRTVGRSRAGQPALTEGFCRDCGRPFKFVPALAAGDRVGQYEVAGCLAYGGQGWVYLARDRKVAENRWVVLKGLRDAGDPEARAAAFAERQYLASVDHPNIVKIYNFVEHGDDGYIVMEYIAGTSFDKVLAEARRATGAAGLPLARAVAHVLAILPAFGYLHRLGLIYCDFKPANLMIGGDTVKLIDLGGAHRVDDADGPVYGTPGYQAPEVARTGPTVASDLYTVGRTLAALAFGVPEAADAPARPGRYESSGRHESLDRLLRKATALEPDRRFTSADEMAGDLLGVLREIVAFADPGRARPAVGRWFGGEAHLTGEGSYGSSTLPLWAVLPRPVARRDDPAAPMLATLPDDDPHGVAELLEREPRRGVEVELRLVRSWLEAGRPAEAEALRVSLAERYPRDWRVQWYRGLRADGVAVAGRTINRAAAAEALDAFELVYGEVPGEAAPKLAVGFAAERAGRTERAREMFDLVTRIDPACTAAAFGLARVCAALGERAGAVEAYGRVPPTSAAYPLAQENIVRICVAPLRDAPPTLDDLAAAAGVVETAGFDDRRRAELTGAVLLAAAAVVAANPGAPPPAGRLLGCRPRSRDLLKAAAGQYRAQARATERPAERTRLVDEANRVRPWTWW